MQRRDFFKTSLLATGTLYAGAQVSPLAHLAAGPVESIRSPHLRLEFDGNGNRLHLFSGNDQKILQGAMASVAVAGDQNWRSDGWRVEEVRRGRGTVTGLEGPELSIRFRDDHYGLVIEWRAALIDDRPAAVIELTVTNQSGRPLHLTGLAPIHACIEDQGGCYFGGNSPYTDVHWVMTNGYYYADPGDSLDLVGNWYREYSSQWNAAYVFGNGQTMMAGFLDNFQGEGELSAKWWLIRDPQGGSHGFNFVARSCFRCDLVLPSGGSVSSGRLFLRMASQPQPALEDFAATCGRLHVKRLHPPIQGWCSWGHYHLDITEDEVLENASFMARELRPYGLEYVQIDDGYERALGDWEGNEKFPHGMAWLAGKIRELGLKPGIWLAPFAIAAQTEVARQHPEWLVRDKQGRIAFTHARAEYALDITHPGARQWLFDLFHKISHDWGYQFVKIDFVDWTLLAAERFHDPAYGKAGAYRLAFETIRQAVGPECHILDCGPAMTTVGLIDSTRINQDQPALTWDQYSGFYNSNAFSTAKRYYFHRRTWINDDDHLGLALLTLPQAQAAATIIAISGGNMISGDDLAALNPERLAIFRKVLPAFGTAARPLDYPAKKRPEIFSLPVQTDFGSWTVLAVFNYDAQATVRRTLKPGQLGLTPGQSYLFSEFWTGALSTVSGDLSLDLEPSSVRLFAVRRLQPHPQLGGTNRHFTQGGVELHRVQWDDSIRTWSCEARGVAGASYSLSIFIPAGYRLSGLTQTSAVRIETVATEPSIARVHVQFDTERSISVEVRFERH